LYRSAADDGISISFTYTTCVCIKYIYIRARVDIYRCTRYYTIENYIVRRDNIGSHTHSLLTRARARGIWFITSSLLVPAVRPSGNNLLKICFSYLYIRVSRGGKEATTNHAGPAGGEFIFFRSVKRPRRGRLGVLIS